ncbi:MAG: cob(I)yrinic acid a,c-diamide adenosyltransferase, partial [Cyanobium sp.]
MTPSSSTQTPQRGTGRGIGIRTAAGSDERAHGQLHVYDGDGKGKSQAALGVVLRTIGLGICEQRRTRVLLLRFLKGPGRSYDEDAAIEALQQGFPHLIDQVRTGRGEFFTAEEASRFDHQEAQRGWDIARGAIASNLYSVVVLDELNPVLDLGLLDTAEVVRTLAARPPGMEIICTGRGAPPELVQLADLHSE